MPEHDSQPSDGTATGFSQFDDDYDYESQADDWNGERGRAEAVLDTVTQTATTTTAGEQGRVEGGITPAGSEKPPKQYLLSEPATKEEVDAIPRTLLTADHHALVETVVEEPRMYHQRWKDDHTELEREKLWQLCCDFLKAEEIVPYELIQQAEQRLRE